jgi:HD-GYP domain-containing protein (c-di-GMP phosphodiesterase class II)
MNAEPQPVGSLASINAGGSGPRPIHQGMAERLACYHDQLRTDYPGITHVSIAIHDRHTDLLHSFVHSSEGVCPFEHSAGHLADLKGLAMLSRTGATRIIDDLSTHVSSQPAHCRRLVEAGYLSSYTVPIMHRGAFLGFVFLNSPHRGYFKTGVVRGIRSMVDVLALTTVMELDAVRMIQAAVLTVRQISRTRDEETGAHLERMGRFSRLIAQRLAPRRGYSEEWVEFLHQFAPLHDIGKIGVPDHILFKPGRLTDDEFEVMKTHVTKGVEIVDVMAGNFRLGGGPLITILHNVVAHHHEAMDGSGYPLGLSGAAISLEGRIVAVADVFDALTSVRPYKKAWSVEEALDYLRLQTGRRFDPEVVEVLAEGRDAIDEIRRHFEDEKV